MEIMYNLIRLDTVIRYEIFIIACVQYYKGDYYHMKINKCNNSWHIYKQTHTTMCAHYKHVRIKKNEMCHIHYNTDTHMYIPR